MHIYNLEELNKIAQGGRDTNITKAAAQQMRDNAVFVCEDQDYFVVKDAGGFVAIIGAELLGCDEFEINFALAFKSRDGAIACALAWSCSDAGGADSTMTAVREMSDYCSAWS